MVLVGYQLIITIDQFDIANIKIYFIRQSKTMGQGQSRREENLRLNKIDPNQWKVFKSEGQTQYATDSQGREAQISILKLDPNRKIDDQMEVYTFRRKVQRPLVKCYGAQPLNKSDGGLCGAGHTMKVITQRVVKRWIQLPQLTFPEILHALQQSLKGYYTLFKQAGPFEVNSNMIGINKLGELLVWLNKNFADNNPSLQRGILYATGQNNQLNQVQSQNQMVRNILNVIEQRCQQGRYPSDFKKLTERMINQNVDFKDALNTIKNYITVKNIAVVDKIHPDSKKMFTLASAKVQQQLFTPLKKTQDATSIYLPQKDQIYKPSYNYSGKGQLLVTPKNPIVQQKFEPNSGFILGTPKQLPKETKNYVVQERFTNDFRRNPNINTTDSVLYQGSPLNSKPLSPMVINKTPTITQTITGPTPVTFTNPSLLAGLPTKNITLTKDEMNKPASIINSYNGGPTFNGTTNFTSGTNFSVGTIKTNQFGTFKPGEFNSIIKSNQFGITPITFNKSGAKVTSTNTYTKTTYETKEFNKDGVVTFGYQTKPQGSQIQTSQVTRQF